MELLHNIIPTSSPVFKQLDELAANKQIVIFSGLPGVGKSLYVREFHLIAKSHGREIDCVQWDVARKSFETEAIMEKFPIVDGTVHSCFKLIAGRWLMDEVSLWIDEHWESDRILLIEAPLVGHRFIELIQPSKDKELEKYLTSDKLVVVMPIPSSEVRAKIEAERIRQVKEDAKVWSGAKPSVMLMLWKMTCGIANEFGKEIDLSVQPPYDSSIYEFVFSKILRHRNFIPLFIDEVFEVPEENEEALHDHDSMKADEDTANHYAMMIQESYTEEEIDDIISKWYLN